MSRSLMFGFISAAVYFGGISASPADDICQLVRYASLDLGTVANGGVFVPMTIAGRDENLLVDTGGFASSLSASAVNQLSLRHQAMPARMKEIMYGGLELRDMAVADEIGLGHMKGRHIGFVIMPDRLLPPEVSGTIAPDIMKNYDVELDFAKAKYNLFSADHCDGRLPYWTHDTYAQLPMRVDDNGHVRFAVRVDGKPFEASLDTGSSRSMMRFENAKDTFGWDATTTDLKTSDAMKVDGAPVAYKFPFKLLNFAGVTVTDPDIVLVPDKVSRQYGQFDLIIGMGILRQLHVYMAYKEGNLYLTSADAH